MEDDSDRKAAFDNELANIQISLRRLRLHAHVPERFKYAKEETQVCVLDVLSAMLDLMGQQLSHLKKVRASIFNDLLR